MKIDAGRPVETIRDLSDFCEAWPKLRESVLHHIQSGSPIDQDLRDTLNWMCLLSDRVCAQTSDLEH
ncbi:hypothetical protein [uncultured Roseobacter sp.]|uniref:hypothetical protein n=1 Tax=uncultured Roseobacter sp. TaxID=114847 RepID=UPI0026075E6C|nr:hypothetical protein [uncultured Roseobacter sp.]